MVSLRYAWNLAHGDGLVWNPDERVEGITSFFHTIIMTLGALFLDKSGAALFVQMTGIALVLGVAYTASRLSRSLGAAPHLALVTVVVVLAYYPLSFWSLMGMETGLLAALSTGALFVAMELGSDPRGSKVLGVLLGLMFATRPDAAVPAAVIVVFRAISILFHHRRLRALAPWFLEPALFVGIALLLTLFRITYYGSPVPNTYDLKLGDWPLGPRLANGWRFIVPFFDKSRYLLLLALASLLFRRDARRLLLLCFVASIIAAQIWVGGDAWPYFRMLVPGAVASIVLAMDAVSSLIRLVSRPERLPLGLGVGLMCSVGALFLANRPFVDELFMKAPADMVILNQRTVRHGIELSRYADPRASVAVMAAGTLPYYSGLRGVDVLGKSDRHIARTRPHRGIGSDSVTPGHNKYDLYYSIGKLRPDVLYDALGRSRYQPGIFELVKERYVQHGAFWFRRDSPYIHWDRLPPL
jgi:arabinofuranosyltransferase